MCLSLGKTASSCTHSHLYPAKIFIRVDFLAHTLTRSLTHTHTHTHTHTLTLTHTLTYNYTHSHTNTYTDTLTHKHTQRHMLTAMADSQQLSCLSCNLEHYPAKIHTP